MIRTEWYDGKKNPDYTEIHAIRRKVFIEEQGVSGEEEMDSTDGSAVHLLVQDGQKPVATGRMLVADGLCMLGRVAVMQEERGKGYGDLVMRMLIRRAFEEGYDTQYIHAQVQARGFYEKLGFVACGDEFDEAGIPHISMRRQGDVTGPCGC